MFKSTVGFMHCQLCYKFIFSKLDYPTHSLYRGIEDYTNQLEWDYKEHTNVT